jgi:hypothetical protein
LDWKKATEKIHALNTIAALTFHIGYYVTAILQVLESGPLDARDRFSFDLPALSSQEDWENLVQKMFNDVEKLILLIARLPTQRLSDTFTDEKYGDYYRNLQGLIEHTHYHLGQIVILKKMLQS